MNANEVIRKSKEIHQTNQAKATADLNQLIDDLVNEREVVPERVIEVLDAANWSHNELQNRVDALTEIARLETEINLTQADMNRRVQPNLNEGRAIQQAIEAFNKEISERANAQVAELSRLQGMASNLGNMRRELESLKKSLRGPRKKVLDAGGPGSVVEVFE